MFEKFERASDGLLEAALGLAREEARSAEYDRIVEAMARDCGLCANCLAKEARKWPGEGVAVEEHEAYLRFMAGHPCEKSCGKGEERPKKNGRKN